MWLIPLVPPPPPDDLPDCGCGWRAHALAIRADLEHVKGELDALKRRVFGKRSEKMPSIERQLRNERPVDRAAAKRARAENAARKKLLATEIVNHAVPADQRTCPACGPGAAPLSPVGTGKESIEYVYIPGHFRRRIHRRETLACGSCDYIVTAKVPARVTDKTAYGPGFMAHVIVSKCSSSMPIYRLEKEYKRMGIPIARSTMNELLHRGAELLTPLARRLLARVAAAELVQADETSHRLQTTKKRAYLWTFIDGPQVAYQFSPNRSGETPKNVLAGTTGKLVVDGYTGYNRVTDVGGRTRAGCMAHVRRKFFEALKTAPEAQTALDLILDVYRVERDAREREILGTEAHLALRKTISRPILGRWRQWLDEQKPVHPPKGPIGKAIAYA